MFGSWQKRLGKPSFHCRVDVPKHPLLGLINEPSVVAGLAGPCEPRDLIGHRQDLHLKTLVNWAGLDSQALTNAPAGASGRAPAEPEWSRGSSFEL